MNEDTNKTQNLEQSQLLMQALEKLGVSDLLGPEVLKQAVLGEALLKEAQSIIDIDQKQIH